MSTNLDSKELRKLTFVIVLLDNSAPALLSGASFSVMLEELKKLLEQNRGKVVFVEDGKPAYVFMGYYNEKSEIGNIELEKEDGSPSFIEDALSEDFDNLTVDDLPI